MSGVVAAMIVSGRISIRSPGFRTVDGLIGRPFTSTRPLRMMRASDDRLAAAARQSARILSARSGIASSGITNEEGRSMYFAVPAISRVLFLDIYASMMHVKAYENNAEY